MQAWLKKEADMYGTYSIEEINLIPTGVQGLAIVCGIVITSLVMIYPMHIVFSVVTSVLLFANVCLRVWHIPLSLHCKSLHKLCREKQLISLSPLLLPPWLDVLRHTNSVPMGQHHHERRQRGTLIHNGLYDDGWVGLFLLLSHYSIPNPRGAAVDEGLHSEYCVHHLLLDTLHDWAISLA